MKILFLDESGDANLHNVDPSYPVFVLGGIIIDEEYYKTEVIPAFEALKETFFGRTDIILHTADISRNRNGFEGLIDMSFRQKFFQEINHLMRSIEYEVLACAIEKRKHVEKYAENAQDPYELSLHILVERFFYDINEVKTHGKIIAEKRHSHQDSLLMSAWQNCLCKEGTYFLSGTKLFAIIDQDLRLEDKKNNIIGLQMADLVVSPIGRWAIGKKTREDWEIIRSKFRRNRKKDRIMGYGLVCLPK